MSQICKVAILGGDARQFYMAQQLYEHHIPVAAYGLDLKELEYTIYKANSIKEAMSFGNVIVCPVPFTKNSKDIFSLESADDLTLSNLVNNLNENHILFGGCICKTIKEYCTKKNIPFYDFMDMDSVSIANAVSTAEGTIAEAIKKSTITLHKSHCLVLGFGRCAKILAQKLKGLDAEVTVAARSKDALSLAKAYGFRVVPLADMNVCLPEFEFIFNTIPTLVMDAANLSYVRKDVTIIDIASSPGGINFEYCRQMHLNASLCLGLPGKYAPKTSAEILNSALLSTLNSITSS